MFCPKCAAAVSDEQQKFCRSCGLQLDGVARIISGTSDGESSTVEEPKERKAKSLRRAIVTIMIALIVGCLIPILAGLQSYDPGLRPLIPILAGVAGIFLFAGVIMIFYSESIGTSAGKSRRKAPPAADDTNRLPPGSEGTPALSAGERTTDLLERVNSEVKIPRS